MSEGRSSTPSVFDTHTHVGLYACLVVLFTYGLSFQTKSSICFSPFLPGLPPLFFFRVSCFVLHVLSHLTPPSHPISHISYRHTLSPPDSDGHTYIHAYIYPVGRCPFDPRSSLFLSLPVSTTSTYPSISPQHAAFFTSLVYRAIFMLFSVFRFGSEVRINLLEMVACHSKASVMTVCGSPPLGLRGQMVRQR